MFDTKIALIVREDLAVWQKLNVVAFLATGIAAASPDAIGEPYVDRAGRRYGKMLGQPMLVFAADLSGLRSAHASAAERGLTVVAYVSAMFSTHDDASNRRVFAEEDPERLELVGLAIRGARKGVDKATKGLSLHR